MMGTFMEGGTAREAVTEAGRKIGDRLKTAARDAKNEVRPEDLARIDGAIDGLVVLEARKAGGEPGTDVEIAGYRSVLSGYAFIAESVAREETVKFATGVAEDVAAVAGAAAKAFARSLGVPIP